MQIDILGAESLGVRGLCCVVTTGERKVVIDPGVALGFRRHGLLPHPIQVAASERTRRKIREELKDATDVVISHYHGDHIPLVDANPYQLPLAGIAELLSRAKLWIKGTAGLSLNQAHRARTLAERLNYAFTFAEGIVNGCLSFSLPVPHGRVYGHGGSVMMTRIEEGSDVFVHASDIQMLSDKAVQQIITWQPSMVLASGPPIYLPSLSLAEQEDALRRTLELAGKVKMLILDHHLLRSRKGESWLDNASSLDRHHVICAADFMGYRRNLLEAQRIAWYKKAPVPAGWHEDYARDKTALETYLSVNNIHF